MRRLVRTGVAALACAGAAVGLSTGCLDRPVEPTNPNTTNIFVTQVTVSAVDKIDLLFVIDNSISMADKQTILREAVPQLLVRLLDPYCEGADGALQAKVGGICPTDTVEEFQPIKNMHIGVVTSSLGGHGGIACSPAAGTSWSADDDDRGELIAASTTLRANPPPTFNGLGFLAWDDRADGIRDTLAINVLADLETAFTSVVAFTGETGCGYEATMEGWYRFLIDPMPPTEVVQENSASVARGLNATLLEQRAQFLRPDSLVAIVMLSDENDCSVRDDGPGYFVAGASASARLPRGTSACAADPNNGCCRSCALEEAAPPDGCAPKASDPACAGAPYNGVEEHANLRCYEQKRRFGLDFLYPTAKYVQALQSSTVFGRACTSAADCPPNPLQQGGGTCVAAGGDSYCQYTNPLNAPNPNYPDLIPRATSELVFLAGIIGVPWQDIATSATRDVEGELEYVAASALPDEENLQERWPVILGDPASPDPQAAYPSDPFMWESVTPRLAGQNHTISGLPFPSPNPITGATIQASNSPGGTSLINGHEFDVMDGGDLQYACIFPLATPRECPEGITTGCDCKSTDPNLGTKPLCQAQGSGTAGTTQYFAKAYPGLRFLDVLKGYGVNSIVGSVCPKEVSNRDVSAYGYNPSVRAIIKRLKEKLEGTCLPRRLSVNPDGSVACQVAEITNAQFNVSCATPGREELTPELKAAVLAEFRRAGRCDNTPDNPCSAYNLCKLQEVDSAVDQSCISLPDSALPDNTTPGYCYIDSMQDRPDANGVRDNIPSCTVDTDWTSNIDCIGNPLLVESCPESQRRILRFVAPPNLPVPVPYTTSVLFVACQGAALGG